MKKMKVKHSPLHLEMIGCGWFIVISPRNCTCHQCQATICHGDYHIRKENQFGHLEPVCATCVGKTVHLALKAVL